MASDSINAYRTVDPVVVTAASATLGRALFGVPPTPVGVPAGRSFAVSAGGTLSFLDREQVFGGASGGLPDSEAAADGYARAFLESANRAGARLPAVRGQVLPALFPPDLRLVRVRWVLSQHGDGASHVLCRYVPYLATGISPATAPAAPAAAHVPLASLVPAAPGVTAIDGPGVPTVSGAGAAVPPPVSSPPVPVYGADVEVRIGGGGAVIGLWSRWRPVRSVELVQRVGPPAAGALLVYRVAQEDELQPLIAAYYASAGDDLDVWSWSPASSHSLVADIAVRHLTDGIQARAVVAGGVGELRFRWAAWQLTPRLSATAAMVGSGVTVELPRGTFNLVLDVEDLVSGAVTRTQALTYGPSRAAV